MESSHNGPPSFKGPDVGCLWDLSLFDYLHQTALSVLPNELDADEECTSESYFIGLGEQLEIGLSQIRDKLAASQSESKISECPTELVILLAGCHGNVYLTETHFSHTLQELADTILSLCVSYFDYKHVKEWLCDSNKSKNISLCKRVFMYLTTRFSKSTLKRLPFHRNACVWILLQLTYPDMSDYLSFVLPFSLQVVDDYRIDLKLQGIQCLRHIVKHSLKAEMRYYGQADVIFDTLKRLTYSRELAILKVIYPCLLEFLQTFDPPPRDSSTGTELCYKDGYDDLFDKILNDIYIESNLRHRRVLVEHLSTFLSLMEIHVVRHSKRFMLACETALLSRDLPGSPTHLVILEGMSRFVRFAWPVLNAFMGDILRILLAFGDDAETLPSAVVVPLESLFRVLCEFDGDLVGRVLEGCRTQARHADIFLKVLAAV